MPAAAAMLNNNFDLVSIVLQLKPGGNLQSQNVRHFWGYAAYAMLLNHLQSLDPTLAQQIHDSQQPAPLTTSNLMGRMQAGKLLPDASYRLRLTAYNQQLSAYLLQMIRPQGSLAVGKQIELDYIPFVVENVFTDPGQDPWASLSSYQQLSQQSLLVTVPDRRVHLKIFTPAIFKHNQQLLPFPLPAVLIHNLLEKWNQHAPVAFPEELKRYANQCLVISKYELQTRIAELPNQVKRPGAVGEITYGTTNYDRYWMSLVHTLVQFAFYAGIGKHTSLGLGQTRVITPDQDQTI